MIFFENLILDTSARPYNPVSYNPVSYKKQNLPAVPHSTLAWNAPWESRGDRQSRCNPPLRVVLNSSPNACGTAKS
jgi:hypothetical protein